MQGLEATAQADLSESEPRRIPAILYPATVGEVQQIVEEARARGTPLYPVSTGMNWGLGSRHPVRDDCVVVDLRRLDRIREVDLAHGYAVIEAGVSQYALAQRLDGTPWMLNVTTSCKDSGLLGNAMDRGEGCIRPRREDLLGLELVLGDGSLLHVRVEIDQTDAHRVSPDAPAVGSLRGDGARQVPLRFVRFEPLIQPKRSLTGDGAERVDTRVLEVIYALEPRVLPAFVGQQMDVFIEAAAQGAAPSTSGG